MPTRYPHAIFASLADVNALKTVQFVMKDGVVFKPSNNESAP
jgi:hypothetical protein